MDWFFNEWWLASGIPVLEVSKEYNQESQTLKLNIKQKQDLSVMPLYTLPIDIDLYYKEQKERKRIIINKSEQEFTFNVSGEPQLVNFDAERQLLCKTTYSKTVEEYIYQYKNAPLFSDRKEALFNLKDKLADSLIFETMLSAAKKDNWWEIRIMAIRFLEQSLNFKKDEFKSFFANIALTDSNTNVASTALYYLGKHYSGKDVDSLCLVFLNSKSNKLKVTALDIIYTHNSKLFLDTVDAFWTENSKDLLKTIAKGYSVLGTDEHIIFFNIIRYKILERDSYWYIDYYTDLVSKCNSINSFSLAFDDCIEIIKNNAKNKDICKYVLQKSEQNIIGSLKRIELILRKQTNPNKEAIIEINKLLNRINNKLNTYKI